MCNDDWLNHLRIDVTQLLTRNAPAMSKQTSYKDDTPEVNAVPHPSKFLDGKAIPEPIKLNKKNNKEKTEFSKRIEDLLTHLEFDLHSGKIWFGGQRMILSHAHALWRLREDVESTLGSDIMQRLFFVTVILLGNKTLRLVRNYGQKAVGKRCFYLVHSCMPYAVW